MRGNWKERKHSMKPIFLWENQLEFLFLRYFYALLYMLTSAWSIFAMWLRVSKLPSSWPTFWLAWLSIICSVVKCFIILHIISWKNLHLALKKKSFTQIPGSTWQINSLCRMWFTSNNNVFFFCVILSSDFVSFLYIYKNVCFFKCGDSWHCFGALLLTVSLIMGEAWRSQGNNNQWFFSLKSNLFKGLLRWNAPLSLL